MVTDPASHIYGGRLVIVMVLYTWCLAVLMAPLSHGFKLHSDLLSRWKGENDPQSYTVLDSGNFTLSEMKIKLKNPLPGTHFVTFQGLSNYLWPVAPVMDSTHKEHFHHRRMYETGLPWRPQHLHAPDTCPPC